jgi:hypothetical protein
MRLPLPCFAACPSQDNLVVDVNAAFAKLPTLIPVGNMTFDARLSAPPLVTKAFLQVGIQVWI